MWWELCFKKNNLEMSWRMNRKWEKTWWDKLETYLNRMVLKRGRKRFFLMVGNGIGKEETNYRGASGGWETSPHFSDTCEVLSLDNWKDGVSDSKGGIRSRFYFRDSDFRHLDLTGTEFVGQKSDERWSYRNGCNNSYHYLSINYVLHEFYKLCMSMSKATL